ncbi:hypothetical protein E3T37_03640 [Cryobacterium sp. TMT2-10]|uniref:hypothetical protein n=1 Tax=Cryobacterium sp. TMT2-10 TaxID=1259244 RepID=UPI00106C3025|nr:hypothetical protein [Cryobacterium sp. TMT2-10]TFD41757.1 hypothetical protein E3T37_03640 [Cryobacterium sp. TMT2-10]
MTAIVNVGGIGMDGTYQPGDGVYQVGKKFFSDWYSVSDAKSDIRERPVGHGAFGAAEDWRSSLVLDMDGWFRGASWLSMMNTLSAAVSTGRPVMVSVTDDAGTTSRSVSVRRFVPTPDPGARVCEFSILMVARDPLRYGPAVSVSTGLPTPGGGIAYPVPYPISYGTPGDPGRVLTLNTGAAETFSMLEVTGGMSGGFELVEGVTNSTLRFERPIPDGSTIYLNPRTGRVSMDGPSDVSRYLTRSEFWSVPAAVGGAPGSRLIQFNSLGVVTGTPILTARTSPANW